MRSAIWRPMPPDGDALLLAARKRVGPLERRAGEVEAVGRRERHRALLGRGALEEGGHCGAVVEAPDQHVGQHVQPLHEVELLEDHGAARAPVPQRLPAQRGDVPPFEQHAAGGGLGEAVHHADQGGLARARAADNAHHLPGRDRKGHAVHGRHLAEAAPQALEFQHSHAPVWRAYTGAL
jgi:hypothetical protein